MKIVIAPNSFKGTMSASRAADALEIGVKRVYKNAEIVKLPVADGGEGTVQILHSILGGKLVYADVIDPMGGAAKAQYCILDDGTAIMEMAQASGLGLVSEENRQIMKASSYGTGQMIKDALDKGCKKIIIGLGGSGTNDGGTGMAQALGVCFMGDKWRLLSGNAGNLALMRSIDATRVDERIKNTEIIALCDVNNPLCGRMGASRIYGQQKGADSDMVELMEYGMTIYAELLKRDLGIDVAFTQFAGAAGGLGAGLKAFCGAELVAGAEKVLELCGFEKAIEDADYVITGEGKTDDSTVYGKAVSKVAELAKRQGKKTLLVSGAIECSGCQLNALGLTGAVSLTDNETSIETAMAQPELCAAKAVEKLLNVLK